MICLLKNKDMEDRYIENMCKKSKHGKSTIQDAYKAGALDMEQYLIDKACNWINLMTFSSGKDETFSHCLYPKNKVEEAFRKAMLA